MPSAPVEVDAADERVVRQERQARRQPRLIDGGDDADVRLVRELAPHAADRVVRSSGSTTCRRYDRRRRRARRRTPPASRRASRRSSSARRGPSASPRRGSSSAPGRRCRPSSPGGQIVRALRRAADAPRVEQVVAAVVAVRVEAEVAGSLDEERPPLVEERLERRQVDDRRIGLDLAEVRVDAWP